MDPTLMFLRSVSVIVLLVACGIADQTLQAARSQAHEKLLHRSKDFIPLTMGEWAGERAEVDAALVKHPVGAEARTYLFRNGTTGMMVWVGVTVGPPGLVTEDLPEKTFRFIGYAYDNESFARVNVSPFAEKGAGPTETSAAVSGEIARMNFWSRDSSVPMRVWQGWFDGSRWSRPDFARWSFWKQTSLVRLQVWCPTVRDPLTHDQGEFCDPSESFLQSALAPMTESLAEAFPDRS